MDDERDYDHFHVVAICVECADIDIIAIARDESGLHEFFANIQPELEKAAEKASQMGLRITRFEAKVIVPDQVATIIPEDGHQSAHVVVAVAHKCEDIFEYCCEMQNQVVLKKMVNKLARGFMSLGKQRNPEKTTDRTPKTPKQDERARNLLDSLDLSDDLFKGMN